MRPKFVIALGLVTFVMLGAILLLKRQMDKTSAPPIAPPIAVETAPPVRPPRPKIAPVAPPVVSNIVVIEAQPPASAAAPAAAPATVPAVTNVLLSEEERHAEIDRLQDWGMKDDAGSLSKIVADLTSPDKEVRAAAIEATKQFGSADAIPYLKAAAASANDVGDRIDYLEAADFLSLPPMVITPTTLEQAIKLQAEAEAKMQAHSQPGASGQNP